MNSLQEEVWMNMMQAQYVLMESREWWRRQWANHKLCPVISDAFMKGGIPKNWQDMILQFPHWSEDKQRIAFTPSEEYGERDRVQVLTIGKYLTRYFDDLPDHVIRDIVAKYTAVGDFALWDTMEQIVQAVQEGPDSCMQWTDDEGVKCHDGERRHPYEVYDPELGWKIAVRLVGKEIHGRSLVYHAKGEDPYFVRSYKKNLDGGYSYADEHLEVWMKNQGICKQSGYDGAYLKLYEAGDTFLAPYIDGADQSVDIISRLNDETGKYKRLLQVTHCGEYECHNTDGYPDDPNREYCNHCNDSYHGDDMIYSDYYGESYCQNCIEEDFVYAMCRHGNEYVRLCDTVSVGDDYYADDCLDYHDIVQTYDGDYEHKDDCWYVDRHDEWYPEGHDDVIYSDYSEQYELINDCHRTEDEGYVHEDDCWQCEGSGDWYSIRTKFIEIDDERYHPDHVPADADIE